MMTAVLAPVGDRLAGEAEEQVDAALEGQVVDRRQTLRQRTDPVLCHLPRPLAEVLHHHALDLRMVAPHRLCFQ